MIFIQGDRFDRQFLIVLSPDRKYGVFITEATQEGKVIPLLIHKGKITEVPRGFGHIRQALFGMNPVYKFKEWLQEVVSTHPDNSEIRNGERTVWIDLDTGQTVDFVKGELTLDEFSKVFLTESTKVKCVFHTNGFERYIDAARGSIWLAKTLKENGYAVSVEGEPETPILHTISKISVKDIFRKS